MGLTFWITLGVPVVIALVRSWLMRRKAGELKLKEKENELLQEQNKAASEAKSVRGRMDRRDKPERVQRPANDD